MKKVLCLLAAAAGAALLCGCSIDSQGFYSEEKAGQGADAEAAVLQTGSGVIQARTPSTDIAGCNTFTEILDRKYGHGSGYTNFELDGTDVLLISDSLFDLGTGEYASTGTEVYCYEDGAPKYLGYVKSGGSANPLSVAGRKLYAAGHHYISKVSVVNEELVTLEEAWETFDDKGNVTYHYSANDGMDYSKMKSEDAAPEFDRLIDEYMNAEILRFDQVVAPVYTERDYSMGGPAGNGVSTIYSSSDIDEAAEIVRETIAGWDRIELLSLDYGGDEQVTEENLRWMNQLRPDRNYTDVIEMVTSFKTPEDATGAWEPDMEYVGYQWWLARTADGKWELLTWGY